MGKAICNLISPKIAAAWSLLSAGKRLKSSPGATLFQMAPAMAEPMEAPKPPKRLERALTAANYSWVTGTMMAILLQTAKMPAPRPTSTWVKATRPTFSEVRKGRMRAVPSNMTGTPE